MYQREIDLSVFSDRKAREFSDYTIWHILADFFARRLQTIKVFPASAELGWINALLVAGVIESQDMKLNWLKEFENKFLDAGNSEEKQNEVKEEPALNLPRTYSDYSPEVL